MKKNLEKLLDRSAEGGTLLKEYRYDKNEIILYEGDPVRGIYWVRSGQVKATRQLSSGREVILDFYSRDDWFGEVSLLNGGVSTVTVIALQPTKVRIVDRPGFERLLGDPTASRSILKVLARRCDSAWSQIGCLGSRRVTDRVKSALYELSLKQGVKTDRGVMLEITQQTLADYVGITRESVVRELGRLKQHRILRVIRGGLLLTGDPEELNLSGVSESARMPR